MGRKLNKLPRAFMIRKSLRTINKSNCGYSISLNETDFEMISLLVAGSDNKSVSKELNIPLSTVQRRTINLKLSGIVTMSLVPNFKRLGIKKGLLHVYLSNGDIKKSAVKLAQTDGILSTGVHVGNSDIVGEFVYEDSKKLVDTIYNIKHFGGVDRVLWSEEVYKVALKPENIRNSFRRKWNNHYNNYRSKTQR